MSLLPSMSLRSLRTPVSRVCATRMFSTSSLRFNEEKPATEPTPASSSPSPSPSDPKVESQNKTTVSRNKTNASNSKEMSPESILEAGFQKMRTVPGYRKSDDELEPLIAAGKKLGISESSIRDIYKRTDVGKSGIYSSGPYTTSPGADSGFVPGSYEERAFLMQNLNASQPLENAHRPFEYDDIPSLGHIQLRDHRVQREYNRVAAYELPQLSKFASEYKPPAKSEILRFRYTTYMGENHAGEAKVVVSFKTSDLEGFNDKQRHKLRLLAGTRYDHETDIVKMSSSAFPEVAQNVRYLGDIIRNLIDEAKDLSKDSFEDIPLSTSHVTARKRRNKPLYPNHKFPDSWKRPQDASKPKSDAFTHLAQEYAQIGKL